jgi:4-carboxymuconolactone decarboxylase
VTDERYERGWEKLQELAGADGKRVIETVEELSPDLARLVVEFGYGDIYTRPGLDIRQRQLIAIAALTALGGADAQLDYHVRIGLDAGLKPSEIVEAIVHCIPFVGFARVLNAARAVKRAFAARGISTGTSPAHPGSE